VNIHIPSEPVNVTLLTVKRESIVKALGVPHNEADDYLIQLIDEMIARCMEICNPRAAVSVFDKLVFNKDAGEMVIDGTIFSLNKMVTSALAKSTSVAFFTGTCGEETGQYSKKLLKEGHTLEGLIADLIGSEIAEGVADYIHKKVESDIALEGMKATNRYSPGYCNWPVSDQQKLFRLIGKNNCGIRLTESSLMLPIKSVSGVIGLGRNVIKRGYACAWCDADHCLYRDKKNDQN
jgi:Vitamin B12 dependent methionine synthase, activation domain